MTPDDEDRKTSIPVQTLAALQSDGRRSSGEPLPSIANNASIPLRNFSPSSKKLVFKN